MGLNREHLWPDWMQRALPEQASMQLRHARQSSTGSEQTFSKRPFRMTVRAVCEPCNRGWMADIERDAGRIAAGMLSGEARDLGRANQGALAIWAVLKAMVFEHSHAGDFILAPESHYRHLYERRTIPPSTQVWIARVDPNSDPGGPPFLGLIDSRGLTDPDHPDTSRPPRGYTTTIGVNQLVFTVFGWRGGPILRLVHGADVGPALRQIWPVEQELIRWPFQPTLTVRGLLRLAAGPVDTIWRFRRHA